MTSYRNNANAKPCPSCLRAFEEGHIRAEAVQPLPDQLAPPRDLEGNAWCHDCSSACTLSRISKVMTWEMARLAVGNDRQEQLRMPGIPMGLVKLGLVRPSAEGDFERHIQWLESIGFRLAEERDG